MGIEEIVEGIKGKLTAAGFYAYREYDSTDSLLHRGEMLGIYSIGREKVVGEALIHQPLQFGVEKDYEIKIRLLGKCCGYTDFDKFSEGCEAVFHSIAADSRFLFRGLELSGTVQTGATKRLEKVISFTARVTELSEVV